MIGCVKRGDRSRTIADRVEEYGGVVRERIERHFRAAGVSYPPKRLLLIGIKQDRSLEVYGSNGGDNFRFIRRYPVLAASGVLGPKLREGDRQVPEGIYRIRELNPNSRFHLSLWIDYPNEFDRRQAMAEGRSDLGGEIMIHGDAVSAGCLAVGDSAAEDLFVLAALTGIENVSVILTPVDFRNGAEATLPNDSQSWLPQLYAEIRSELLRYPKITR